MQTSTPDGQLQRLPPSVKLDVPLLDFSTKQKPAQELEKLIENEVSSSFDLTQGPLLRVRIVRLSNDHHVVVWTAHHVVCDGWSGGLIVSELAKIYSALKQGATPVLDAPESFRQYAITNQGDSQESRVASAYWSQQFADIPTPLELPADRLRPVVRTAQASTLERAPPEPARLLLQKTPGG